MFNTEPSNPEVAYSQSPHYMRAKKAAAHFRIAPSTLWHWVKTRPGFPAPLKAGPKVTLFDIGAIEAYIKGQQQAQPARAVAAVKPSQRFVSRRR